jgi:hypothetical protein
MKYKKTLKTNNVKNLHISSEAHKMEKTIGASYSRYLKSI